VLVGITDTAFEESITMARVAAEHGASAVVVAAPFLMSTVQNDLQAYLKHLVSQSPLPVYLYHVPPLTKTRFELETVRWAMDQECIIGLKDSAGDLNWCEQVCALLPRRPDWSLLAGPEELLADYVARGAHGGVCGGANCFPNYTFALMRPRGTKIRGRYNGYGLWYKPWWRTCIGWKTTPLQSSKP
jgi:4-hydroxy-tetrahydrodipicolinate synthase